MKIIIYYNPRCSKSRATKALLEENGVALQVIEYLKTPPPDSTLRTLLAKLSSNRGHSCARVRPRSGRLDSIWIRPRTTISSRS